MTLIGSVNANVFHTKTHYCGRYDRDMPIIKAVRHIFRDSERDAECGWVKNGNFSVT